MNPMRDYIVFVASQNNLYKHKRQELTRDECSKIPAQKKIFYQRKIISIPYEPKASND